MRIVSLLGSATEIVYALGLDPYLVGISHECDYPLAALSLPRVSRPRFDPKGLTSGEIDAAVRSSMRDHGGVYEIDSALLAELRPTLVLTQAVCEVCAVPTGSVQEAVSSLPGTLKVVSLDAHTIEGILGTIGQVADAAEQGHLGEALVARLRARMGEVQERVAGSPEPEVLLLEWLDPPFAPGHWVPEMVSLAGGRAPIGRAGTPSREVSWADLSGLEPEVLLIEPCGFDLSAAEADADRHFRHLSAVAGGAIRSGRAWVLHSAWFSRSGPRVVEGIEVLARILHPWRFPGGVPADRARLWSPSG